MNMIRPIPALLAWSLFTFMVVSGAETTPDPAAMPAGTTLSFDARQAGAVGDGHTDDTDSLNRLLATAIKADKPATIRIPKGTYRLSATLRLDRAHDLTLCGEPGALLVMNNVDMEMMNLNQCRNIAIDGLTFDRDPLSFTQGTIIAVDPAAMTCSVRIDAGYQDPDAPRFDKAGLHPFVFPESGTYQLDRYTSEVANRTRVSGQEWRFALKGHAPTPAWAGKRFFFGSYGRGHCFVGRGLTDCTFTNIAYWGGGGNAGVYLSGLFGTVAFRHFTIGVPPHSDRLVSCAGGGQISNLRGHLVFDRCDFTKIDDDGLDLLGTWVRIVQQTAPRTLVLQNDRHFVAGDHVAIWDWKTKASREQAIVVTSKDNADHSHTIVLDRDVTTQRTGAGDGQPFGYAARDDGIDRVVNLDSMGLDTAITDCRFQVFRAKCLNVKAANLTISGCTFFDSWQPAISAAPEWYFQEGPPIRNLVIRNNVFINCNHTNIEIGASINTGYDRLKDVRSPSRDTAHILIEGNRFTAFGAHASVFPYWGVGTAIRVQHAQDVTIRGNTIGESAFGGPAAKRVIVEESDEVIIEGNSGWPDSVIPPAARP